MFLMVVLALLLASCASNSQPVNTTPQPAAVPRIPDSVGAVVRIQTHTYPDTRLGALHRYRDGDFRPDVYVYSKTGWGDPQSQARSFMPTLDVYQQRGEYDSYQVVLTRSINLDIGGRVLTGHETVLKLNKGNTVRDSYFAVVSLPTDEYVKFRITRPADDNSVVKARDFVNAWIGRYVGPSRN